MPENSAIEPAGDLRQGSRLVVVGIGAVGASIPSVGCVLARLPAQSGLAVLIVLQDHQPDDLPGISATLARAGRLPVELVADGLHLQRGHVYLAPAGALLTLEGARVRVAGDGDRGALDTFLRSLAEQHGEFAIAIALAGVGYDGALGLAAVKLNGGLILAESVDSASKAQAPYPIAAEGIAELMMPADQIGRHIVAHVDYLGRAVGAAGVVADSQPDHGAAHLRDEHVRRLESELRLTKDRLQATIEELESTNSEPKSSGEKYQAANEELRSANVGLQTVNGELAKANSDLKNLLESTQIATIFLDNDLRVKTFTPSVTEIFHLIENDTGRPITHIASRIAYDGLEDDVRKVLRTLATVEREVGDPRGGSRYLVRVLPYRSIDNFIAGAVLTFLDVTPAVRAEEALRKSEQRLALAQAAGHIGSWTRDAGTNAQWWSPTMFELHGLPPGETPPADSHLAFVEDAERARFEQAIAAAFSGDGDINIEYRIRHPLRGERWLATIGQAEARSNAGQPMRLVGVTLDISDQKQAERRSALMLAELQHRVRNTLAVVRSLAARSLETSRTLDDFRSHFEGRLGALGRTHGVLARLSGGEVDLEELVRDELLAQAVPDDGHLRIVGPRISLRQKAAELFGLALHELATNAVKYGALARPPGDISVTWRIFETSGGPRLTLEWLEKTARPVRQRQRRRGFGSTLIEQGLPYDLGAATSLEIGADGVRCTIELPLDAGLVITGAAEAE